MLAEECERLAVHQREERLVGRRPDPVPRPVERVRHGRAQHAVQVHLRHLAPQNQEVGGEYVKKWPPQMYDAISNMPRQHFLENGFPA